MNFEVKREERAMK